MPATSIRSGWSSGSLVFHDKTVAAPKTGYNILTIGSTAVTIGDGTKDIDFKWYGTSSDSFILDAGAHTLTMAGLNVSLSGDIALTAEDLSLVDDQDLEYGTGTDVLMRWSTADDSDHAFVIALGDTSQQMHITDKGAVATDWARSAGTHPELAIHSNTTPATDYLAIGNHDGTTAYINNVGGTTLALAIDGTTEYSFTASSVDFNDNNITELGDVTPSDGSIIAAIDGAGTTLLLKAGGLTGTTFITLTSQSGGTDTMTLGALTLGGAITGGSQNMTGMGTINGLAITANTGAITTGTWTATVITPAYGGTGVANNVASTLTISGSFGTTFTVSNTTSLVLPTTGTVATLAGTEEFDNKTLDSSVGKGTWTASGTWTLPAHTMASTLTFSGGSAYIPIQAGTKDNTAGAGFKISSASADNSGGVQLYADDGGSALASPAEVVTPFRSRYLVTAAQSGGVTQAATFSQLRTLGTTGSPLILNTGIWESAYIFAQLGGNTIEGGAKIMGINQATTLAGNMIVTSGEFAGIDINIAGTGAITNNSTCAGLIIRSSGTPVWSNGIQIANSGAVTGILIGTCTTAINTGVNPIILSAQPAVASGSSAINIAGTSASSAASNGLNAYIDLTLSGTPTDTTRNVGIWTNFAAGMTYATSITHYVLDVGAWHGDNDCTGSVALVNLDFQIAAASNPDWMAYFRCNADATGEAPDYLFLFENNTAMCYTASDPGTSFSGYIKIHSNTDNKSYAIPVVML